jgi:hypothetical protein
LIKPTEQDVWQVPPLQTWPTTQAVPAEPPSAPQPAVAPQFVRLVCGSMHLPPQLIEPTEHESWQVPALQTWPTAQAVPAEPPSTPQPAVAPQC